MKIKPIVHFVGTPIFETGVLGSYALCQPVDHPDTYRVSNLIEAYTSEIIDKKVDEDMVVYEFTTKNTIYKKKDYVAKFSKSRTEERESSGLPIQSESIKVS